jgi:hypothetical protein
VGEGSTPFPSTPSDTILVLEGRSALLALADVFADASPDVLSAGAGAAFDAFADDAGAALGEWFSFAHSVDAAAPTGAERDALWRVLRSTTPDLQEFETLDAFEAGVKELFGIMCGAVGRDRLSAAAGAATRAAAALTPPALHACGSLRLGALLASAALAARDTRVRARVKEALVARTAAADADADARGASAAGDGRALLVLAALASVRELPTAVHDEAVVALLLRKLSALEGQKGASS